MRKIYLILLALFTISLVSCSYVSVTSDYDIDADFSKYKTYQWKDGKKVNPDDILQGAAIVRKRIMVAVDKNLEGKGFTKLKDGEPDMFVLIHAGVKEKMNITDWGYGYGGWYGGPYGGYGSRNIDVSYYEEGTVFIDFVDNEKDELVWRGAGTGIVKNYSNPEEREIVVRDYVTKIMANFPPQK